MRAQALALTLLTAFVWTGAAAPFAVQAQHAAGHGHGQEPAQAAGHGQEPAQASDHGANAGRSANAHMNERPFEALIANFESPERMGWQRPEALLDSLGALDGKTVADIGSGSGFLAFRMAARGARVLCVDVDERFLAYILGKRDALGMEDRIALRLSPYDRPALASAEADLVITVNTYHHIEDRVAYFRKVRDALKPGGQLVVVDFKAGEQPVGPGPDMKIDAARIETELRQAGFGSFELDEAMLPYQFVLRASS